MSKHVFGYVLCDFCQKGEETHGTWLPNRKDMDLQIPVGWIEVFQKGQQFCSTKCAENQKQVDWVAYRKKDKGPYGNVQCLRCYGYGYYTTPKNKQVLCACHLYKGEGYLEVKDICEHCNGTGRVQTDCNDDSDICRECRQEDHGY